jgi:uncharacterized Fe-S radical SAM superfamily protein PflX
LKDLFIFEMFLKDFEKCELCEHRCKGNRLAGETGICQLTLPVVASATLHPAPAESDAVSHIFSGINLNGLKL